MTRSRHLTRSTRPANTGLLATIRTIALGWILASASYAQDIPSFWSTIDDSPPGSPTFDPTDEGDPVEIQTGYFLMQATDILIPGRGINLEFIRSYRSNKTSDGPFGPGWDHSFNRVITATNTIGGSSTISSFIGFARSKSYTLQTSNGSTDLFYPGILSNDFVSVDKSTSSWTASRTTFSGQVFNYSQAGVTNQGRKLLSERTVTDEFGNALTLTYNSFNELTRIDGVGGVSYITLDYTTVASKRRIWKLTDNAGHVTEYSYFSTGANAGFLWKVTAPATPDAPQGRVTTYSYDASGHLTEEFAPASPAASIFTNEFDAFHRVTKQYVGTPTGAPPQRPFYQFIYGLSDTAGTFNKVVDPRGKERRYYLSAINSVTVVSRIHLFPDDGTPAPVVTTYEYDTLGNVTKINHPDSRSLEYVFDSGNADPLLRRNLLVERQLSNDGSPALRSEYTYESGRVKTYRDPRTCAYNDAHSTSLFTYEYTYYRDSGGRVNHAVRTWIPATLPNNTTQGRTEDWQYNSGGQLTQFTDARGTVTTFEYSSSLGLPSRVVVDAALGGIAATEQYGYDAVGNITSRTDAEGRITTYTVDAGSFVNDEQAPTLTTHNVFDSSGRRVRTWVGDSTPFGDGTAATEWSYDQYGHVIESRKDLDSAGGTSRILKSQFAYDAIGNKTDTFVLSGSQFNASTDAHEQVVYNYLNLPQTITAYTGTTSQPNVVKTYTYDTRGRTLSESVGTSSPWQMHRFEYDGYGRPRRVLDPDNAYEELGYDENGNATRRDRCTASGALLTRTLTTYDEWNRVSRTDILAKDHAGTPIGDGLVTMLLFRDAVGNITKEVPEVGVCVEREFDRLNRVVKEGDSTSSPLVQLVTSTFDRTGMITSQVVKHVSQDVTVHSDLTLTTAYSRDSAGRITQVTGPLGTTTFQYDSLNRARRVQSPAGLIHEVYYDEAGNERLSVQVRTDNGNWTDDPRTERQYDNQGRLQRIIEYDPSLGSETTTYDYDAAGRVTLETYSDATAQQFWFDERGNVSAVQDASGSLITNSFGTRNELTGRTIQRGTGVGGATQETWTFDEAGRLIQGIEKNPGTFETKVTRTYSTLGTVDSEALYISVPGGTQTYTSNATLDSFGRLLRVTYPTGTGEEYVYDTQGRVRKLTEVGGGLFNKLTRVGFGRVAKREFPHSETVTTFNAQGLVAAKVHRTLVTPPDATCPPGCPCPLPSAYYRTIGSSAAEYDGDGRPRYIDRGTYDQDGNRITSGVNVLGQVLRYDAIGRVQDVYEDVDPSQLQWSSPTLYRRRVSLTYADKGVRTTRSHDGVLSETYYHTSLGDLLGVNSALWQYRPNGTTQKAAAAGGNPTYVYDAFERLIEVTGSTGTTTSYCDVFGRRLAEVPPSGPPRFFVWWGNQVVQVFEGTTGGTLKNSFYYDGTEDAPQVMRTSAGAPIYLMKDLRGDIQVAARDTASQPGYILEDYRTDFFGVPSIWAYSGGAFALQTSNVSTIGNQFASMGLWVSPNTDPILIGQRGERWLPERQRTLTRSHSSAAGGSSAAKQLAPMSDERITNARSTAAAASDYAPVIGMFAPPLTLSRAAASTSAYGKGRNKEGPSQGPGYCFYPKKSPDEWRRHELKQKIRLAMLKMAQAAAAIADADNQDGPTQGQQVAEATVEMLCAIANMWNSMPSSAQETLFGGQFGVFVNIVADALYNCAKNGTDFGEQLVKAVTDHEGYMDHSAGPEAIHEAFEDFEQFIGSESGQDYMDGVVQGAKNLSKAAHPDLPSGWDGDLLEHALRFYCRNAELAQALEVGEARWKHLAGNGDGKLHMDSVEDIAFGQCGDLFDSLMGRIDDFYHGKCSSNDVQDIVRQFGSQFDASLASFRFLNGRSCWW